MNEGADLPAGYVEPIAEMVDDLHAIAMHLHERVRTYETLLSQIAAGWYGCSTWQLQHAIRKALPPE